MKRWAVVTVMLASCRGDDMQPAPDASTCMNYPVGNGGNLVGSTYESGGIRYYAAKLRAIDAMAYDEFRVTLKPGRGVFAGGLQSGTYTIAGDDANETTCGLCVSIDYVVLGSGGAPHTRASYLAVSGTLTLMATTTVISISGSGSELRFMEVFRDLGDSYGCVSMTSVTFY